MLRTAALLAALAGATSLGAQTASLTPGRAIHGSLAKGDTARYQVMADSNSFVRAKVDQIAVDVVVRVLAPGGRQVLRVDGPARGEEWFQFEAVAAGTYQVQVIPFEEETGAYSITLVRREPLAAEPRRLVDQLLAPWDRANGPGVVVSVWRGGRTLFAKAYGMADLTFGVPFAVNTPTNIGSTSKQFTAFAVLLLAEEGKLSLDDDVRKHIPELPDLGKVVTVRHILTHTSGYREFLNALALTGRRLDRGDFIDRAEVISLVQRQPALQNDPGAEWNYNNTAFALAAVVVERISGLSFADFMARNVFQPLGMTHTMVRPSPEHIVPGRAAGYAPGDNGTWLSIRDLGGSTGAGGIYSTVGDLQIWAENLARPRVGTRAMVEQMMTPYTLTDGKSTGYGLGLSIDTQGPLKRVHHGGADRAHRSQLVYYPEIDAGLTVQSNDAGFNSGIAFRLAAAFFRQELEVKPAAGGLVAFDPASFVPARFDEFAGRYALDAQPAFVMTFSRSGDSLFTQATGQPRFPIFPTSDSTFALRVVEASVTFHRGGDGQVNAATLHQGGANQRASRLVGEPPPRWAPTADQLRGFEGRYFSEELETFYTVVLKEGVLVLEQRRLDPITLRPGAVDTFAGGNVTAAFERDRNGRVIGFYLSNVRTRGVRFERLR
jgi:CubicO group peptidase (beta-lactamase class C family)